jgi:hypothetical protein
MFIVISDPCAADDLVRFLCGHGCRAGKRTPFVVEVERPASEGDVERLLAAWEAPRENVAAELVAASGSRDLTPV